MRNRQHTLKENKTKKIQESQDLRIDSWQQGDGWNVVKLNIYTFESLLFVRCVRLLSAPPHGVSKLNFSSH